MSRRIQLLRGERTRIIDEWVASQCDQKDRLPKESPEKEIGIHVLDRCILGPMSFKRPRERAARVRSLLDKVWGAARDEDIRDGMVFLLEGDAGVLETRCRATGKGFTRDDLAEMQAVLRRAYRGKGLKVVDARRRARADIVKQIVQSIYTGDYGTIDLKRKLTDIESGRLRWQT